MIVSAQPVLRKSAAHDYSIPSGLPGDTDLCHCFHVIWLLLFRQTLAKQHDFAHWAVNDRRNKMR